MLKFNDLSLQLAVGTQKWETLGMHAGQAELDSEFMPLQPTGSLDWLLIKMVK